VRVADGAGDAAALERARQARSRLHAGEAFDAVRGALGDAEPAPLPDTALPPAKLRDYLGPTALAATLRLAPGEVSEPVRSSDGYQVTQVVAREPGRLRSPRYARGARRTAPPPTWRSGATSTISATRPT
jgi:hypothetical protein